MHESRSDTSRRLESRNAKNSTSKLKIILPKYADETRDSRLNIVYHIRGETACDVPNIVSMMNSNKKKIENQWKVNVIHSFNSVQFSSDQINADYIENNINENAKYANQSEYFLTKIRIQRDAHSTHTHEIVMISWCLNIMMMRRFQFRRKKITIKIAFSGQ